MRITAQPNPARIADIVTLRPIGRSDALHFGGLRPGPTLLVTTGCGLFDPISLRLAEVPSLGWMQGRIILARLAGFDGLADHVDDTLTLPQTAAPGDLAAVDAAYWTILRKATRLGMIAGRGVPAV